MAIGSAIGAIGGVLGAKAQSKAADKAADASLEATQLQVDLQREIFEQSREDTAPWREIGAEALGTLKTKLDAGEFQIGDFDFEADPGYQFRLDEGMKALERSAAARGNLLSGAQLKAGQRYAQDFASNEYQNAFNRDTLAKQTEFNQYAGLAGVGQTAVAQAQQAGQNFANQAGNAILQGGAAQAAAYQQQGAAKADMWGNIAGSANNALSNIFTYAYS